MYGVEADWNIVVPELTLQLSQHLLVNERSIDTLAVMFLCCLYVFSLSLPFTNSRHRNGAMCRADLQKYVLCLVEDMMEGGQCAFPGVVRMSLHFTDHNVR